MKDYQLKFTTESEAKTVLSNFYDAENSTWITDNQFGSLHVIGTLSVPIIEDGVVIDTIVKDGFFISLRLRTEDASLDQYVTNDPDFNHSFGELPIIVPHVVPVWAIRTILDLRGYGDRVNTLLANLPDLPNRCKLRIPMSTIRRLS